MEADETLRMDGPPKPNFSEAGCLSVDRRADVQEHRHRLLAEAVSLHGLLPSKERLRLPEVRGCRIGERS